MNGRTITDKYIVRVDDLHEATETVDRLKELGYVHRGSVEKINCYYIGREVVFDDGSETLLIVNWGRDEVMESDEFKDMVTYNRFISLT